MHPCQALAQPVRSLRPLTTPFAWNSFQGMPAALRECARLLPIIALLSVLAPCAAADVLLSELCDPRNDYLTDRYIEIWNPGPDTVDLTGWRVVAVGNSVEIFTWVLSGAIAPGEALVWDKDVAPVQIAFNKGFLAA